LLLCACHEESPPPPVLLVINEQEISLPSFQDEFEASLRNQEAIDPTRRLQLQRTFMARLVDRVLLEQEAQKRGISINPAEMEAAIAEFREQYPAEALEEALVAEGTTLERWQRGLAHRLLTGKLAQAVAAEIEVSDEMVRRHFDENTEQYRRPAQVRARQLVVSTEEEALEARQRILDGDSFAQVAQAVSLSPDAEEGGDLGFFAHGEMPPEFDEVVFSLPLGQLSEPVHTPYGWHLFLVEEKRPAMRQTFEQVEQEIRQALVREQEEQAYQQWLQGVRARSRIEIDWSLLARQTDK
jgi:peptidyl-prolyl cis-trans isomerase C